MRYSQSFRARGFSLVFSLFLIVVIALLAASLARLNQGAQSAVAMEVLSTRAQMAAESGLQEAGMRLFPLGAAANNCTVFPVVDGNRTLLRDFATAGLRGCTAKVICADGPAGSATYVLNSEGFCGAGSEMTRRKITMGLRNISG